MAGNICEGMGPNEGGSVHGDWFGDGNGNGRGRRKKRGTDAGGERGRLRGVKGGWMVKKVVGRASESTIERRKREEGG